MQRFFSWLIALLIIAASVWGSVQLFKTRPSKAAQAIEESVWPVSIQTLKLENIRPSIPLYGRLEAPQSAELKAAVIADVLQINTEEGMSVNKGELLIQLDAREFELQVAQRQADIADIDAQIAQQQRQQRDDQQNLPLEKKILALNQTAVQRLQQLQKKNLGSQADADQAKQAVVQQQLKINSREQQLAQYPLRLQQLKAQRRQRQALLAQAQLQVERCQIKAPFSGLIANVAIAQGAQVRSGDKLLRLYNPDQLRLRAQIPKNYQNQVERQLKTDTLIAQQSPDITWRLARLAGESNAQTAGIDGLFVLNTPQPQLRLGQFVALQLQLAPLEHVYNIPQAALYEGNKVYVLEQDRLAAHQIQILARIPEPNSQRSQLLARSKTLLPNMSIVTTQLPNAISGLKVKVLEPDNDVAPQ